MITVTTYGLSSQASASYAYDRAVEEAILLVALTGSIYPSDELFMKKVVVQIIERVTIFATHARRAAEIIKSDKIVTAESRWRNSGGPQLERNFWTIVNKVLHAHDVQVATADHGATMFAVLRDRVITHIDVQSDRGGNISFCPYGLVYGFLSQQLPKSA